MEPRSAALRAGVLLVVEGAVLALVGLLAAVLAEPDDRSTATATAAFAVVGGVILALLGKAMLRGAGWARTPSIVLQLLAFPVGTDLARGQVWVAAVPVLLLAGATTYHLVLARRD